MKNGFEMMFHLIKFCSNCQNRIHFLWIPIKLPQDRCTCSSNLQFPQPSFEVILANYLVLILIKHDLQLEMCYQWKSAVGI